MKVKHDRYCNNSYEEVKYMIVCVNHVHSGLIALH